MSLHEAEMEGRVDELEAEVEKLEGELAIAKAFHDVAVKERNFERVVSSRLQSELNTARTEVERLREAAKQALESMAKATRYMSNSDYIKLNQTIDATRAALKETK
jgi:hypothetical protein